MNLLIRLAQLILILIPLALFAYLSEQYFVPSGVFEIKHQVNESSPYIDALAPSDRVEKPAKANSEWSQAIISDPVFFFLHPHRDFSRLAFEIWFQNDSVPIIEFGGLTNTNPEAYNLRPLHNLLIDSLKWPSITKDGLTLWQKQPKFNSIDQFFASPPPRDKVAVYKADYRVPFRLSNYFASDTIQTIDASLRGRHEMKTYIKNETLSFEFEYMDMNRDDGADPITAIVFNESGKPVADAKAEDDGDVKKNAVPSSMKKLKLFVPGLAEGVYKIVWNAPRDIFIRKIRTTQNKLIFLNTVYIGDDVGYRENEKSTQLFSASERFQIQTRHAEGVQAVKIGSVVEPVAVPYEMYTFKSLSGLKSVEIPKGDLEVFFDGPTAFSSSQYFTPDPVAIRSYTDIKNSSIEYILTSYVSPQKEGKWLIQTFEFDAAPLVFEKESWKFAFSSPMIDELAGKLLVKEINMKWFK